MAEWKKGDAVTWNSPEGTIEGKVVRKVTAPIDIKGHHVAASPEHPEYVVRSDRTGAEAAHQPDSLKKKG